MVKGYNALEGSQTDINRRILRRLDALEAGESGETEDITDLKNDVKDIQDARDIHYEDDRSKFTTDAEFANFRNISVGNLLENKFYRSASPCDNQHNRAPYVDTLIHGVHVQFILDLAKN